MPWFNPQILAENLLSTEILADELHFIPYGILTLAVLFSGRSSDFSSLLTAFPFRFSGTVAFNG